MATKRGKKAGIIAGTILGLGILAGAATGIVYGVKDARHTTHTAKSASEKLTVKTAIKYGVDGTKSVDFVSLSQDAQNYGTLYADVTTNSNQAKISYQWYHETDSQFVIPSASQVNGDYASWFSNEILPGATGANLVLASNKISVFNPDEINYYVLVATIDGTQYVSNILTVVPYGTFTPVEASVAESNVPQIQSIYENEWAETQLKTATVYASIFNFLNSLATAANQNSVSFTIQQLDANDNTITFTYDNAEYTLSFNLMSAGGLYQTLDSWTEGTGGQKQTVKLKTYSAYEGLTLTINTASKNANVNTISSSVPNGNWTVGGDSSGQVVVPYLGSDNYLGQISNANYSVEQPSTPTQINVYQGDSGKVTLTFNVDSLSYSKNTDFQDIKSITYEWGSLAVLMKDLGVSGTIGASGITSYTANIDTNSITSIGELYGVSLNITYINGQTQNIQYNYQINVVAPNISLNLSANGLASALVRGENNYNVDFNLSVTNPTVNAAEKTTLYFYPATSETLTTSWLSDNAWSITMTGGTASLTAAEWSELWSWLGADVSTVDIVAVSVYPVVGTQFSNILSFNVNKAVTSLNYTTTVNGTESASLTLSQFQIAKTTLGVNISALTLNGQSYALSDSADLTYDWNNGASTSKSYTFNPDVTASGTQTISCVVTLKWNGLTVSETINFTITVTAGTFTTTNLGTTVLYQNETRTSATWNLPAAPTGWSIKSGSVKISGSTSLGINSGVSGSFSLDATQLNQLLAHLQTSYSLVWTVVYTGGGQTYTVTYTGTILTKADTGLPSGLTNLTLPTQKFGYGSIGDLNIGLTYDSAKNTLTVGSTAYTLNSALTPTFSWSDNLGSAQTASIDLANLAQKIGQTYTYVLTLTLTNKSEGWSVNYTFTFNLLCVANDFDFTLSLHSDGGATSKTGEPIIFLGQTGHYPYLAVKGDVLQSYLDGPEESANCTCDWTLTNGSNVLTGNISSSAWTIIDPLPTTGWVTGTYTLSAVITLTINGKAQTTSQTIEMGQLYVENLPTITTAGSKTISVIQYFGNLDALTAALPTVTLNYNGAAVEPADFGPAYSYTYTLNGVSQTITSSGQLDLSKFNSILQTAGTYTINVSISYTYLGQTETGSFTYIIDVTPTTLETNAQSKNYSVLNVTDSDYTTTYKNNLTFSVDPSWGGASGESMKAGDLSYAWTIVAGDKTFTVGTTNEAEYSLDLGALTAKESAELLAAGTYQVICTVTFDNGTFTTTATTGKAFSYTVLAPTMNSGIGVATSGTGYYIEGQDRHFTTYTLNNYTVDGLTPSFNWTQTGVTAAGTQSSYIFNTNGSITENNGDCGIAVTVSYVEAGVYGTISRTFNVGGTYLTTAGFNDLWTLKQTGNNLSATIGGVYPIIQASDILNQISSSNSAFSVSATNLMLAETIYNGGEKQLDDLNFNTGDDSAYAKAGTYTINGNYQYVTTWGLLLTFTPTWTLTVSNPTFSGAFTSTNTAFGNSVVAINDFNAGWSGDASVTSGSNFSINYVYTVNGKTVSGNGAKLSLSELANYFKLGGDNTVGGEIEWVYDNAGKTSVAYSVTGSISVIYSPAAAFSVEQLTQTPYDNLTEGIYGLTPTNSVGTVDWYYNVDGLSSLTAQNVDKWTAYSGSLSAVSDVTALINSVGLSGGTINLVAITNYSGGSGSVGSASAPYDFGQSQCVTIKAYSQTYLNKIFGSDVVTVNHSWVATVGSAQATLVYKLGGTLASGLTASVEADSSIGAIAGGAVVGDELTVETPFTASGEYSGVVKIMDGSTVVGTVTLPSVKVYYYSDEATFISDNFVTSDTFPLSGYIVYCASDLVGSAGQISFGVGVTLSTKLASTSNAAPIGEIQSNYTLVMDGLSINLSSGNLDNIPLSAAQWDAINGSDAFFATSAQFTNKVVLPSNCFLASDNNYVIITPTTGWSPKLFLGNNISANYDASINATVTTSNYFYGDVSVTNDTYITNFLTTNHDIYLSFFGDQYDIYSASGDGADMVKLTYNANDNGYVFNASSAGTYRFAIKSDGGYYYTPAWNIINPPSIDVLNTGSITHNISFNFATNDFNGNVNATVSMTDTEYTLYYALINVGGLTAAAATGDTDWLTATAGEVSFTLQNGVAYNLVLAFKTENGYMIIPQNYDIPSSQSYFLAYAGSNEAYTTLKDLFTNYYNFQQSGEYIITSENFDNSVWANFIQQYGNIYYRIGSSTSQIEAPEDGEISVNSHNWEPFNFFYVFNSGVNVYAKLFNQTSFQLINNEQLATVTPSAQSALYWGVDQSQNTILTGINPRTLITNLANANMLNQSYINYYGVDNNYILINNGKFINSNLSADGGLTLLLGGADLSGYSCEYDFTSLTDAITSFGNLQDNWGYTTVGKDTTYITPQDFYGFVANNLSDNGFEKTNWWRQFYYGNFITDVKFIFSKGDQTFSVTEKFTFYANFSDKELPSGKLVSGDSQIYTAPQVYTSDGESSLTVANTSNQALITVLASSDLYKGEILLNGYTEEDDEFIEELPVSDLTVTNGGFTLPASVLNMQDIAKVMDDGSITATITDMYIYVPGATVLFLDWLNIFLYEGNFQTVFTKDLKSVNYQISDGPLLQRPDNGGLYTLIAADDFSLDAWFLYANLVNSADYLDDYQTYIGELSGNIGLNQYQVQNPVFLYPTGSINNMDTTINNEYPGMWLRYTYYTISIYFVLSASQPTENISTISLGVGPWMNSADESLNVTLTGLSSSNYTSVMNSTSADVTINYTATDIDSLTLFGQSFTVPNEQ